MTDNVIRRCAICKRRLPYGTEQNDVLVMGANKTLVGRKIANVWVCSGHQYTLFKVSIGDVVVTKDDAKEIRIGTVENVAKSGSFTVQKTLFSQFGYRMRGYGTKAVVRVATAEDLERHRKQELQAKLLKIEQDEVVRKKQELQDNVLQKFKVTFPQLAEHVSISSWDDGKFEFTIFLTADEMQTILARSILQEQ